MQEWPISNSQLYIDVIKCFVKICPEGLPRRLVFYRPKADVIICKLRVQINHHPINSALTQRFLAFYSPYHRGFSCKPLPVLLVEGMVRKEKTLQQIILNHSLLFGYGE